MTAVRYKGPPDTIRLGAKLIRIGDTISAPDELVTQLLAHSGFDKVKGEEAPSAKASEKPLKKSKKKPSTSEGEK